MAPLISGPRHNFSVVPFQDTLYLIGGEDQEKQPIMDIEIFSLSSIWEEELDRKESIKLNVSRVGSSSVIIGDRWIYVMFGEEADNIEVIDTYNMKEGSKVIEGDQLNKCRFVHSLPVVFGEFKDRVEIYLIGGCENEKSSNLRTRRKQN